MRTLVGALVLCVSTLGFLSSAYADLEDGLVAYWPFNGNANDESGNGHDGTVYGATLTADRFGVPDRAYRFNGVDNWIDIGPGVKPGFPLTVSAWVRPDSVVTTGAVFRNDSINPAGCCYYGVEVLCSGGKLEGFYGDGGYAAWTARREKFTNDSVLAAGVWHHLVVRFNAHQDIDLVVDGLLRDGSWGDGVGDSVQYSGSSGSIGDQNQNWYWFAGAVDELRVYDRALTDLDIRELFEDFLPDRPALIEPANGAVDVSRNPVLRTGPFSDPDPGDTHYQTEWQISTAEDFSSYVLNVTSREHLTTLKVPQLALAGSTVYHWRVRYFDDNPSPSLWSEVYSFTTVATIDDENHNGIPDDLENETLDLDGNGVLDHQEEEIIKSLNTVLDPTRQMGVTRRDEPKVLEIRSIDSVDPDTISRYERPYFLPLGLLGFNLLVANPGDEVTVRVYFSEAAGAGARWLLYDTINGWADYSDHAEFSQDRKSVTLHLKDGGHGDADGEANGVIVDPGGFGMAAWVEGFVFDAVTQAAITSATVRVGDNLVANTLLNGRFQKAVNPPGIYQLSASAGGYRTRCFQVDFVEADVWSQDIAMTQGEGSDCPTAAVGDDATDGGGCGCAVVPPRQRNGWAAPVAAAFAYALPLGFILSRKLALARTNSACGGREESHRS